MFNIDLKSRDGYEPLNSLTADQLFSFGVSLARIFPKAAVRCPTGDGPEDSVTLTGRVLSRKGVEVF